MSLFSLSTLQSRDILFRDNVSLLGFSSTRAVFALTPPSLDVYSSQHGPFCHNTQFHHAVQILSMTLENFLIFAQELG